MIGRAERRRWGQLARADAVHRVRRSRGVDAGRCGLVGTTRLDGVDAASLTPSSEKRMGAGEGDDR